MSAEVLDMPDLDSLFTPGFRVVFRLRGETKRGRWWHGENARTAAEHIAAILREQGLSAWVQEDVR